MHENILVEDPHPHSQAAAILLREQLGLLVPYRDGWRGWLRFRLELLTRWLAERGELRCHYCGKGPLPIEDTSMKKVATLDHVHPLAAGGAKFDEANLVVACQKCNQRKGCRTDF